MANIGQPFQLSDLTALAVSANSISPSNPDFDLVHFYDLPPIYNDDSGNPWGHREMRNVTIAADFVGQDYVPGDILNGPYGSQFEVEAVGLPFSRVLLLRVISPGLGHPDDPDTVAFSPTGGSGNSLNLTANFPNVGLTAQYSFPDFNLTDGKISGLVVLEGGVNYKLGDQLTFAEFPGETLTVTQLDPVSISGLTPGKVFPFTPASTAVPANGTALNAIGGSGSGAVFSVVAVLNQRPAWLTELQRLRSALLSVLPGHVPQAQIECSVSSIGVGWPRSSYTNEPTLYDPSSSFQEFYYEDTGQAESITLSGDGGLALSLDDVAAHSPYNAYSYTLLELPQNPAGPYGSHETAVVGIEYRFKIKNPQGATFSGTLQIPCESAVKVVPAPGGVASYTQAAPSLVITGSFGGWIPRALNPGATFPSEWVYECTVSGLVDGDYSVIVSGGFINCVASNPGTGNQFFTITFCTIGFLETQNPPPIMVVTNSAFGQTVWHGVPTAGIDNAKAVYKIRLPQLDLNPIGIGVTTVGRIPVNGFPYNAPQSLNPVFGPALYSGPDFGYTLTISHGTMGFWVGSTAPVSNIKVASHPQMPWNLIRTKFGTAGSVAVNPHVNWRPVPGHRQCRAGIKLLQSGHCCRGPG